MGGILAMNLRMALQDFPIKVDSVIGGLGGRPITRVNLRRMFDKGVSDQLEEPHFHDIHMEIVNRELEREKAQRRSGSIAENVLQDVGVVAAAKTI
jgi:pyruvate ferredoxin oxidoreductase alpha subunit